MYDQPEDEHVPTAETDIGELKDMDWWQAVREIGRLHGFKFETITLDGESLDIKVDPGPEPSVSEFGKLVLDLLENAGSTYKQRNAIYQDNFRVVGKVMEALFPGGAPALHDHHDYNRWHIFELMIVKLTRYVANWGNPDPDSLLDLLPYVAILGAQDEEMKQREQRRIDDEIEQNRLALKLLQAARGAGLHVNEAVAEATRRELREQDNEARMYSEDDAWNKVMED